MPNAYCSRTGLVSPECAEELQKTSSRRTLSDDPSQIGDPSVPPSSPPSPDRVRVSRATLDFQAEDVLIEPRVGNGLVALHGNRGSKWPTVR
jgi:hypothetical protein